MKIAVISGKGGAGKTFVAVNLACASDRATYADCDVEEPNGHLFLKPSETMKTSVTVMVPEVDGDACNACRKCVEFCKYHALALIRGKLLIFQEVCHSCGGCVLFCPTKALGEKQREIGYVETGESENVAMISGCMNTGEASGVPIIKRIMEMIPSKGMAVIDCPPGSACLVMESINTSDYCVLVAEPTLFGAYNLEMVYDLVKLFHKPFGVVLNKCLDGENPSEQFCLAHQIPILYSILYDPDLGRMNAGGLVAVRENDAYKSLFHGLLDRIHEEAGL